MTITKSLNAKKREGSGKGVARKLRQAGQVPAVLYGKGMESVSLSIDAVEAGHLFAAISVENTIIELQVEGETSSHQTLVREIQAHPFKKELVHVDFLRLQMDVEVDVEVPVELDGTPVGVKTHGGILEHMVQELPVRCLPSNIPEAIRVDVTGLDLDQSIHVRDLKLPEGVVATVEGDRLVCIVAAPRGAAEEEAEAAAAAAAAAAEPEVITQKKEVED
ncbi:MAG: 50S ribosomal protein L25/general stress protein Ctc [Longimicrobiales bacterium]|nr:50S ribosomal protein L25/general stress protein Ctc [Longimicrobiales bacterium]